MAWRWQPYLGKMMLLKKTQFSNPLSYCWSWLNQPLALNLSVTPHCHLDNDQMPQHDSQTSIQTSVLPTLEPQPCPPPPGPQPDKLFAVSSILLSHFRTSPLAYTLPAPQNILSVPPYSCYSESVFKFDVTSSGSLPDYSFYPPLEELNQACCPAVSHLTPSSTDGCYYKCLFISLSLSPDLNSLSASLRIWNILSPQ